MRMLTMVFKDKIPGVIYWRKRPSSIVLGKGIFECTIVQKNLIAHLDESRHVFVEDYRKYIRDGMIGFYRRQV